MIDDTTTDINELDHGPFAHIPNEAFEEASMIAGRARGLCVMFCFSLVPYFGAMLYLFIYPITIYWLIKYVRLKFKHPLIFQFRQFYPGESIRDLKKLAKQDYKLGVMLRLRMAFARFLFLLIWPALILGLWFMAMASNYF